MQDALPKLRHMQRNGAGKIHSQLVAMRDEYAFSLNEKLANDWLQNVEVFLIENGILVMADASAVPDEALATKLCGDTFEAFQIFSSWLLATRGMRDWPSAFAQMERFPGKPGDLTLVIAIANAFGKAERYLNQKEDAKSRASMAAQGKRPNRISQLRERVRHVLAVRRADNSTLINSLNDWTTGSIEGLRLTYLGGCKYQFEDKNATEDFQATYSLRALKKMWGQVKSA